VNTMYTVRPAEFRAEDWIDFPLVELKWTTGQDKLAILAAFNAKYNSPATPVEQAQDNSSPFVQPMFSTNRAYQPPTEQRDADEVKASVEADPLLWYSPQEPFRQ
jgi:hypothetical protein